jgi:16S rRNA processing protein RimM
VERGRVLIKLEGAASRGDAEALVGATLYIPESEAVRLPPGAYFWHDIVGLQVRSRDGLELGAIAEILETGSNDVYVVRGPRGEVLIPATHEVVQRIDLEAGIMEIEIIEGLLPE